MRLIDADKLYLKTKEIDTSPTIDAIPIEWFTKVMGAVNNARNYEAYEILNWLLDEWKNNRECYM